MKLYYADAQNKTAGPVTWKELQNLIRMGSMKSDPLVIPEGGTEWKPLSTFAPPEDADAGPGSHERPFSRQDPDGKRVSFSSTFWGDLVAAPLQKIQGWLNEEFTSRLLEFCRNAGHYAILAGGVLGLIYCVVTAIRGNQLVPALIGAGFVIALAIAQFVAMQFLRAGDALIANTPHRISSKAFLECYGLFSLLWGMAMLAGGIYRIIEAGGSHGTMTSQAVAYTVVCSTGAVIAGLSAAVAFNPQLVNISSGSGGAGEEAVGILGFFLKAFLKLLPIQFLSLAVVADLWILSSFSSVPQPDPEFGGGPFGILMLISGMAGPYVGIILVLAACLLPFLYYCLFLLFNLGLEIIRAVLSLTGKRENQDHA